MVEKEKTGFAAAEFNSRTALLVGSDGCEKLASAHVLVLGVGGVGGYAVENLVRAGIGRLTLVDGDSVDPSNSNRQLSALTENFHRDKCLVWQERCHAVNPDCQVVIHQKFIRTQADIDELLDSDTFDYAVDAIDEIAPKIDFICSLKSRKIPFVSSMGAGGKLDPGLIGVADISRTSGCPLARVVRQKLRERRIFKGIKTVYSPEVPQRKFGDRKIGSISYLPAIFGCFCASEAILTILGGKNT